MDVLLRRGSSKALSNYIGKLGELVINTDDNSLRLMNGSDVGGKKISNIISKTSNYGYTTFDNGLKIQYYRVAKGSTIKPGTEWKVVFTLPIKMTDSSYIATISVDHGTGSLENDGAELSIGNKTSSSFEVRYFCRNTGTVVPATVGMSAIIVGF